MLLLLAAVLLSNAGAVDGGLLYWSERLFFGITLVSGCGRRRFSPVFSLPSRAAGFREV
jgi:hypothetical protein